MPHARVPWRGYTSPTLPPKLGSRADPSLTALHWACAVQMASCSLGVSGLHPSHILFTLEVPLGSLKWLLNSSSVHYVDKQLCTV
ncbi:rCG43040 [Rattus norvegicus]|uniref:RCG43040 n=1 Tax=Rattus norvegicus TaxID=10116 RepID=A6IWR1_RAT|nr:rCG43040 [Rattus norvegicus]